MDIVQLISNVGFPIAACVCMGVYVAKVTTPLVDAVHKCADILERVSDRIGVNRHEND